jgi:hypothetical protein
MVGGATGLRCSMCFSSSMTSRYTLVRFSLFLRVSLRDEPLLRDEELIATLLFLHPEVSKDVIVVVFHQF